MKPDIVQRFEEIERRGLLDEVDPEKRAMWEEYKRRHGGKKEKSTWEKIDPDKAWEGAVGVASNLDEGALGGLGKKAWSAVNAGAYAPLAKVGMEAVDLVTGRNTAPSISDLYKQKYILLCNNNV